jgi:gliding motility-associated-like protein
VLTAVNSQVYVVKVTDEDGCMALDTVTVLVNKNRPVYFPNIFAPESDANSHFTGYAGPAAEKIALLRVFDRWGSLVFETSEISLNVPNLGWDGRVKGKDVTGVFTYYALVRFVDQVELQYEGSITVYH